MKKSFLITIWSILMLPDAFGQLKGGIEQYNYFRIHSGGSFVPVVHIQSAKNFYGELRYNYEEEKAFSVNAGMTFSKESEFSFSLTPMVGYVMGSMRGYNLNLNQEAEWRKFFYSTQAQYTINANDREANFFYSWSEAGYNISKKFYAGLSCQFTKLRTVPVLADAGLMAGISFGNFSFPVYYFRPFAKTSFVIAGINYEWQLNRKNKSIVTNNNQ
jgi:hypothetical protein